MSVVVPKQPDPAENWDEDFEFHAGAAAQRALHHDKDDDMRNPATPTNAMPSPPTTPLRETQNTLHNWAEPGPSTPLRRLQHTENWDDDFQDADSPGPSRRGTRPPPATRVNGSGSPIENWDDEFEDKSDKGPSPRKRTPRKRQSWSDEEEDYGFADREDDRTVTSRRVAGVPFILSSDVPPVPPLPSPFPRSPTASVFSVPVSSNGRESSAGYSYSSTAHLALRPTVSGNSAIAARLALLPPSPPHRERRRLRKKSRPPHQLEEEGIFELDDRAELVEQARPVTPETNGRRREPPPIPPDDPPQDVGNTSTTRTPLLSRIGSVGKKWSARKKRVSNGPSDIALRERNEGPSSRERGTNTDSGGSRPTSFMASSSPGHGGAKGWFFRGGGSGQGPGSSPGRESALKHEKSVERLLHLMGVERGREREPPGSPSSIDRKGKMRGHYGDSSSALPADLEAAVDGSKAPDSALFGGTPKRPQSMQVSVSNSSSNSGSGWPHKPPSNPRHVSYSENRPPRRPVTPSSRASSKGRSASASVEDVRRTKKSSTTSGRDVSREVSVERSNNGHPDGESKGGRRFMGNIRRISLGGKHKRNKSIAAEATKPALLAAAIIHDSETQDQSTPRPPSRTIRSSIDVPLLPPIELQPPSPPHRPGERKVPRPLEATPTRMSVERSIEPSRSHPTLNPRSSQALSSTSQETALPSIPSPLPSPTRTRPSTSPVQTASLGRTAQPPKTTETPINSAFPRRNSLGDLKIPARISQAQVGLRRDLSMVRDFATSVDQLKQLQLTYTLLAGQVRAICHEATESQSRPVSPSPMHHFPRPSSRLRSYTSPTAVHAMSRSQLNTAFLLLEAKYRLSWECAELLIDLGGGAPTQPQTSPPPSSHSVPAVPSIPEGKKGRERAITLGGDESKPSLPGTPQGVSPPLASPPSQWRASTGRHDLSQRQLHLLREMLNNPDPSMTMTMEPNIPEEDINRNWRWGDAMNSTITLPSEESAGGTGQPSPSKKRRTSRLGMRHIRDMLRSLKKTQGQGIVMPRLTPSSSTSVSASTDSSLNLPRETRPQSVIHRRRAKTSTGPASLPRDVHPNSPYATTSALSHKASPRRPSLASIFRLGQKSKSPTPATGPSVDDLSSTTTSGGGMTMSGTSLGEDWDHIDSASELDHAARSFGLSVDGTATVRGKKGKSPYLFGGGSASSHRALPEASLSSLFSPTTSGGGGESPKKPASAIPPSTLQAYQRSIKLSDVREVDTGDEGAGGHAPRALSRTKNRQSAPSPSPRPSSSRGKKTKDYSGSVRSAPPQPRGPGASPDVSTSVLPAVDIKLAMAPENIKPLLENAKEVHVRCAECIAELEALLGSGVGVSPA
ncbi:uncharacterized protein BXZ73DRAFT_99214 [Epithele typhae]|uniref:uncharacterized protein n=1 Tax=Epithele typhae TaxID=378194 RepID=UPI002007943D|nr:uncharacterized protein BXZ73DRAFT_99214 [Epithele typhae]KAH9940223.1 hypothetical protein BXZ73DRAFT_99214 [Epithele typhae]